jgi:putative membrane protein
MNQALRAILVNSVAIALVALFLPGIKYGNQLSTLVFAAIVLGIANTFIKPVLALILLPINIVTLGIVGLFMNTILLFVVTLIVPDFNVVPFSLNLGGSQFNTSIIMSYIICSIVLGFVLGILRRIVNASS